MSVEHLDLLHSEMPELFQIRDLPSSWDDSLIIVPIDDPEAQIQQNYVGTAVLPDDDKDPIGNGGF